jgi:two-component system sensor histidine kinase/response regulator
MEAGMVDHISKPIDPVQLFRKLAFHIRADASKRFGASPPPATAVGIHAATADVPDALPGIDIADGLHHLAGNRAAYRRLLLQFSESRLVADLGAARTAGDRAAAIRAAHSLKSVAGTLGAAVLARAAAEAEAALKKNTETPDQLDELSARFAEVAAGLRQWAGREAGHPATAGEMDLAAYRASLAKLRDLAVENDAGALEACESLLEQAPPALRGELHGVHKALGRYDFDAACACLEERLRQG